MPQVPHHKSITLHNITLQPVPLFTKVRYESKSYLFLAFYNVHVYGNKFLLISIFVLAHFVLM